MKGLNIAAKEDETIAHGSIRRVSVLTNPHLKQIECEKCHFPSVIPVIEMQFSASPLAFLCALSIHLRCIVAYLFFMLMALQHLLDYVISDCQKLIKMNWNIYIHAIIKLKIIKAIGGINEFFNDIFESDIDNEL